MADNTDKYQDVEDRRDKNPEEGAPAEDKPEYEEQERPPEEKGREPDDQRPEEDAPAEDEPEYDERASSPAGGGQGPGEAEPGKVIKPPQDTGLGRLALVLTPIILLIAVAFLIRGARPGIYQASDFYVQDQVILSGPEQAIADIVSRLELDNVLELNSSLNYTDLLNGISCPDLPEGENLVVNLYDITQFTSNAGAILRSIAASQQDPDAPADQGNLARAEPNWIGGQPWEVEGGPWEVEGGPWEVEGGADDNVGPEGAQIEGSDIAMGQWSPANIGYKVTTASAPGIASPGNPHVRVGVFDTSPFTMSTGITDTLSVAWVTSPTLLSLLLTHPISGGVAPEISLRDHGLFVSGLAHIVSPSSRIELVRVLQDNNRGDLFTLLHEIHEFTNSVDDERAVANLSLSLRLLPDDARGSQDLSREVDALRDLLRIAHCKEIVVVAAAGNGSAEMTPPRESTIPAAWDDVIGVAASNKQYGRSCYSNSGDIAAPGGDGGSSEEYPNATCLPLHRQCTGKDCEHALVGPVLQTDSARSGYAYWVGSSFATPLVSGLAARLLEEDGTMPADTVWEVIKCSALGSSSDTDLGFGVINVETALNNCLTTYSGAAAE